MNEVEFVTESLRTVESMNQLLEHILNEQCLISEAEYQDRGIGIEPLLQEFVYEVPSMTPEASHNRISNITSYYATVLSRTGDVRMAYDITRKWAMRAFVQSDIKKIRKRAGLAEKIVTI